MIAHTLSRRSAAGSARARRAHPRGAAEVPIALGAQMPLLRTETLFGIKCSIYDNGTVIAGTSSDRITLRLNANEELVPKLRAALIKRGFRTADELPEDASAAAAMAPQPLQPQSLPESETEDEQPAAKATVLFGSKPCKQLRPQRSGENECAQLASTLGKAWEMGQPASRAEGELREITRANGGAHLDINADLEESFLTRCRGSSGVRNSLENRAN